MDALPGQDAVALTYEGLEILLHSIKHDAGMQQQRQKVHGFLFRQFEKADLQRKLLIYRALKSIRNELPHLRIDLVALLSSPDCRVQSLGFRLARTFWRFCEYDEVVVYALRNCKAFAKLLRRNPKYERFYSTKLERAGGKPALDQGGVCGGRGSCGFYREILKAGTMEELAALLRTKSEACGSDLQKVCRYFCEKIALSLPSVKRADAIPGLGLRATCRPVRDGIDLEFELDLLGLQGSRAYRRISAAFEKLSS
ncbi:hypothetical protein PAPHI01_0621 [Pancytospora philotis]|nr:hypothetical protein PAPHI01_0621 [Pancytospora philotis]